LSAAAFVDAAALLHGNGWCCGADGVPSPGLSSSAEFIG
jgi:hypothetical protein